MLEDEARKKDRRICCRRVQSVAKRPLVIVIFIIAIAFIVISYSTRPFLPVFSFSTTTFNQNIQDLYPDLHFDKWVVVTSINYPTNAIKKLDSLGDWQVVVVGDTKSPKDWSYANVVFLDVAKQKQLGYASHDFIPYRHYARKNIGYLFAIQHGAKIIYDTDDDNELLEPFIPVLEESDPSLLFYLTNNKLVNPYAHFGQPSIWPRGFPLEDIAEEATIDHTFARNLGCTSRAAIQQGLANGDPDVDAIFRLTRRNAIHEKIIIHFTPNSPILLPVGTMSPFNSQNTLFHYEALWGTVIPVTTTFRVCDIWRGYWAQRLLWEIGGQLAFTSPSVWQDRNVHNYLLDFKDEIDLYADAGRLVNFLINWNSTLPTFMERAIQLTEDMVKEKFWDEGEVYLISAWFSDLVAIGYRMPELQSIPKCQVGGSQNIIPEASALQSTVVLRGSTVTPPIPKTKLLVRLSANQPHLLNKGLLPSMEIFWKPKKFGNLLMILDDSEQDLQLQTKLEIYAWIQTKTATTSEYTIFENNKIKLNHQYSLFWTDLFTEEEEETEESRLEYIGLIDSKAILITIPVIENFWDENSKPYIIVGPIEKENAMMSTSTQTLLHLSEIGNCELTVPFYVKLKHFNALRTYVEKISSTGTTFDTIFVENKKEFEKNGFSTINIICTYLWYFHREDYSWKYLYPPAPRGSYVNTQMNLFPLLTSINTVPLPSPWIRWNVAAQSSSTTATPPIANLHNSFCWITRYLNYRSNLCVNNRVTDLITKDSFIHEDLFKFTTSTSKTSISWLYDNSQCINQTNLQYQRIRRDTFGGLWHLNRIEKLLSEFMSG